MIAGYGYRPVFQYKFRPFAHDSRALDGGFAVILYENNVLSFSTYDVSLAFKDEVCFVLPSRVMTCYQNLLHAAESWLGSTPCDLRMDDASPYGSSFAFDGYEPIFIWGINRLMTRPICSPEGFYARHVCVLFEDMASLFAENGIHLTLDGFNWESNRVKLFRKNPPPHQTGSQGAL